MSKHIDYYYSHLSIWAYLGHQRISEIADNHHATITHHPFLIGPVFAGTGGTPPAQRSWQRKQYRGMEIKRWQEYLGVSFNSTPAHFPTDEKLAACMTQILKDQGEDIGKLSYDIMNAIWVDEADIADRAVLTNLANQCGFNGAALVKQTATQSAEDAILAATNSAMDAGVFGAPAYVIDGEVFWGQDRLDFVNIKLAIMEG